MNTQPALDKTQQVSVPCGRSKVLHIIPALIIAFVVVFSLSSVLAAADTTLFAVSLAATLAVYASGYIGHEKISSRVRHVATALSLCAPALCATLSLVFTDGTLTDKFMCVPYVAFAIVFTVKRGKLFSPRGELTLCALSNAAMIFVYAAHGEGVGPFEVLFITLACLCGALTAFFSRLGEKVKSKFGDNPVFGTAAMLVLPVLSFVLLEGLTHPVTDISLPIVLLNAFFFYIFAFMLFFIFGNSTPALIVTVLLPLCFGLVSYFTIEFRGTPLFPWDLASYGIAATVLGGYDLTLTPSVAFVICAATLLCSMASTFKVKLTLRKISFIVLRVIATLLMCVLLLGCGAYLQTDDAVEDFDLYPYLFVPHHLYKMNGFAVSFIMNLRYTSVERPDGYDAETVESLTGKYSSDSVADAATKPNVIVIMNESFADMKDLCDFEATEEYMPYISSLEENTQKGILHSSIVGGNTPNSEFEFLTGMTMGFLPSGSIAYQQFLKSEKPSLVSQLDSLGYHTVAMHPYWAEGWKRESVYPMLGFDEMHFLDYEKYGSFNDYPLIREYVSDAGVYEKIRLTYEAKTDDEPLFVFAVTMQNHSGYAQKYDNFTPSVGVCGLEDNFELSTYMSLIRESDAAFGELVEYFKTADEPTVILMFGDHQPNDSIASPLLEVAGVSCGDSDISASEARYKVPYVIWANYELSDTESHEISINYLSSLFAKSAGLPLTAAQKYALELCEDHPVINSRCIISADGKLSPVSDYKNTDTLRKYSYLQYAYLFDEENLPVSFWTLAGE